MTAALAFLLTAAEVAEVLRASSVQVDELVAAGRLPVVRLTSDGPARFRSEDVVALVEGLVADA